MGSWIWNGFDLRRVFAYLCSDLFLDVGLGFPRVRVWVILLATTCLTFDSYWLMTPNLHFHLAILARVLFLFAILMSPQVR